jgi:hypothetical protein
MHFNIFATVAHSYSYIVLHRVHTLSKYLNNFSGQNNLRDGSGPETTLLIELGLAQLGGKVNVRAHVEI